MILNIKSVQFLLEGGTTTNTCTEYACSVRSFQRQRTFVNELNQTYSTAGFELTLERNFLKYIISYYMKSGLLVASSWISFVIPPDVIPGRMALLITLLLALVNLSGTVIDKRPSTKSTTILEIWMFICTSYVWTALVAYAALLMNKRDWKSSESVKPVTVKSTSHEKPGRSEVKEIKCNNWDLKYLKYFPLVFSLINLMYWPIVITYRFDTK